MQKVLFAKVILSFLLVLFSVSGNAQSMKHNQANWFAYVGQFKVSEKWGVHTEAQFRLDEDLNRAQQNLFRLGGTYFIKPSTSITAGYGYITTYNAGWDEYFKENRIWQQLAHNHHWNNHKNTMHHRIRLEQRFVDKLGKTNESVSVLATHYQNRFRYLNRNLIHLMELSDSNNSLYGIIQNEIFVNIGNNKVNSKTWDQNRLFAGLGMHFKNHTRLELGYLNHYLNPSQGNDIMNHTVSLSILQNVAL